MKIHHIIIAAALLTILGSCKNNTQNADSDASQPKQIVIDGFTDTVELDIVPMDEAPQESYFDQKTKTATKSTKPATTTNTATGNTGNQPVAKSGKNASETIYVETDGAQGRVWGHVTMKGDRGTGTIHDWDENTLAVSVTRHGDELFAVDQNSRQYVFKLKK